jgi:ketosteroid isomerase-like protein
MSKADVERARAALAAFGSGDIDRLLRQFHPDFEGVVPPEPSAEPDTYRGHAGIRRYVESFREYVDGLRFVPEELIDAGDAVVVALRIEGRGRGSGVPFERRLANRITVRDGLIASITAYPASKRPSPFDPPPSGMPTRLAEAARGYHSCLAPFVRRR